MRRHSITPATWPPPDPFANLRCPGCGERQVDGCTRSCPRQRERREALTTRAAERKQRQQEARRATNGDEFFARIRAELRAE